MIFLETRLERLFKFNLKEIFVHQNITKKKKKGHRLHPSKNKSEKRRELLPPLAFHFLLSAPTLFSFWFFLSFVNILRPDQQFWPLRYASIHLSLYCVVHLLPDRCLILLVGCVFALNKSFVLFRSALMDNL
jgi:hypothetical protein